MPGCTPRLYFIYLCFSLTDWLRSDYLAGSDSKSRHTRGLSDLMKMTEPITEESQPITKESLVCGPNHMLERWANNFQRAAWKELSDPSIFDKYFTHPFHPYNAENLERNLYCFNCDEIRFQNEKGTIWIAKGSGEIVLPPGIGVFIKGGKSRLTERQ